MNVEIMTLSEILSSPLRVEQDKRPFIATACSICGQEFVVRYGSRNFLEPYKSDTEAYRELDRDFSAHAREAHPGQVVVHAAPGTVKGA